MREALWKDRIAGNGHRTVAEGRAAGEHAVGQAVPGATVVGSAVSD